MIHDNSIAMLHGNSSKSSAHHQILFPNSAHRHGISPHIAVVVGQVSAYLWIKARIYIIYTRKVALITSYARKQEASVKLCTGAKVFGINCFDDLERKHRSLLVVLDVP